MGSCRHGQRRVTRLHPRCAVVASIRGTRPSAAGATGSDSGPGSPPPHGKQPCQLATTTTTTFAVVPPIREYDP